MCRVTNYWILTVLLLACPIAATAQPIQGYGANTIGGNAGEVVVVTNLADSGAGSLRSALSEGNRRIVFKVGGTIKLKSPITVIKSNITIDGSMAPPPGITITSRPFIIKNARDIIVNNLRFRESSDDNLRITGAARNIVIYHCSSTRAADGALDITLDYNTGKRPSDINVSWCLFAGTTKAMLVQSVDRISFHHNLFTNNDQRSPQLHDVKNFDYRNNFVRYWGTYGMRVRAGSSGNIVANVFGPSSKAGIGGTDALIRQASSGPVHVSGNLGPGAFNPNLLSTAPAPLAAPAINGVAANQLLATLNTVGALPTDKIDLPYLQGSPALKPRPGKR